ncbi:MAG: hypothetical protein AAGF04_00605 [Chlamydiota bacterium]
MQYTAHFFAGMHALLAGFSQMFLEQECIQLALFPKANIPKKSHIVQGIRHADTFSSPRHYKQSPTLTRTPKNVPNSSVGIFARQFFLPICRKLNKSG